jgi:hypothetical protein
MGAITIALFVTDCRRGLSLDPLHWRQASGTLLTVTAIRDQASASFQADRPLRDRLTAWAEGLRNRAQQLARGPERDGMLKKARQAETRAHLVDWANSPGLKPPIYLRRDALADEIKCEACNGTGVEIVEQPSEQGKRIFPPRCKVCDGKGRVPGKKADY